MDISVVVPVLDEEESLPILYQRLTDFLTENKYEYEIIIIDDVSTDRTVEVVKGLSSDRVVLVVHEDKVFGGFGGEVVSLINEKAFEYLDGPVMRVGSTFTPVGFNRILEKAILPNNQRIIEKARELLAY